MSATPAPAPSPAPLPTTPPTRRVAVNTALRAAAEVLGKVATLVLTIVMLSQLGPGAVGDFGFALAVTQLYWPLAGFGLDRLMLRHIAIEGDDATARMVPQLNAMKLCVGLVCIVVGTSAVYLATDDDTVTLVTLILGFTLLATLIGATAQSVFMAKERTQDYFFAALPVKVIGAFLGIAVLLLGGGLLAVAWTSLVAALLGIGIGWWLLGRKYGQPPAGLAGTPRTWWPLAREAGPWGMQEVFGQITFRVGIIVLYLYAGRSVTGEYRVAYQLLEATLFLPWSIGTSVLPIIARAQRGKTVGDEPSLEAITRGSIELVIVLMIPIALVLGICAAPLLGLIDDQAVPAADYLPYLAVASVVYGVGHLAGIVALSHLPGRRTVEATALAALFSVTVVLLLIPSEAARGAALAALATEVVLAALTLRLAVRAAGPSILRGMLSIGLVGGAVMAVVMWPLRDHLFLALLAGGTAYTVVVALLEYRRRGPAWELMRSILPGAR